eukprot:scaffold26784_cov113-Cylindrotheca_fusiformis.AAC.5
MTGMANVVVVSMTDPLTLFEEHRKRILNRQERERGDKAMRLNKPTLSQSLLLLAAVYVSWSGLSCDIYRKVVKSIRLRQKAAGSTTYMRRRRRRSDNSSTKSSNGNASYLLRHTAPKSTAIDIETTGITFSRSNSRENASDESFVSFLPNKCKLQEDHDGDNDCHYNWGDVIEVNSSLFHQQHKLDENSYIEGSFQIDTVPLHFTCAMCGEVCKIQATLGMLDLDLEMEMPNCPMHNDDDDDDIILSFRLPPKSPTKGLTGEALPLQGDLVLYSKPTEVIAKTSIDAMIR